MLRILLVGALLAFVGLALSTLVARAYDHELVERVLYTRAGVTLECERVVRAGELYLRNCVRIAP